MLLLGLLQKFPLLSNCSVIKFMFSILQNLAQGWRKDKGDCFGTYRLLGKKFTLTNKPKQWHTILGHFSEKEVYDWVIQ